jgi:hypothetical protein
MFYSILIAVLLTITITPRIVAAQSDNPYYINCPGSETYSGNVYDQEGYALAGVVVYLATPAGYQPFASGSTTSNSNGYWSVTIGNGCPNDASFYWQSDTNGPLLKSVSKISLSGTSYTLNAWVASQNINLLYEFPDDSATNVGVSLTTSLQFSADASLSGGITDGFLGLDAAGNVGTTQTMQSTFQESGTSPYVTYIQTGNTYKVEDTSSNTIIYVQQYSSSHFSSATATEYLTMSQGVTDAQNAGQNPYITIAANHQQTYSYSFSSTITLDAKVSITAFTVTLTTHVGTTSGNSQTISLTITNNNSNNECFVAYQEGPEIHAWYYGSGSCP